MKFIEKFEVDAPPEAAFPLRLVLDVGEIVELAASR
jgi:hypothetical protein